MGSFTMAWPTCRAACRAPRRSGSRTQPSPTRSAWPGTAGSRPARTTRRCSWASTWSKARWCIPRSPRRLVSRRRIPRLSCERRAPRMRVTPAVMFFLLVAATAAESQVRNAELGYSLTLPDGFTDFPEARSQKDVVGAWTEATPVSANGAMVLLLARMHGSLPREAMRQEDVPANTQVVSFKWKGFDVSGLKTLTSQEGKPVFVLLAQVPLRREAVQLSVAGPADQGARGQAIMEATLASLEGETNWLSSTERAGRLGRAAGVWISIAVALVAVLAWRKRRAQAA